jgi:hypothetical protein
MKTLKEVQAEVERLAAKIGASDNPSLPEYGESLCDGGSYIEVNGAGYHLIQYQERSRSHASHIITQDINHLLYLIFEKITFEMACEYELAHRVASQDPRRVLFPRQIDLLSQLSERWGKLQSLKHEAALLEHPLDDYGEVRATWTAELRAKGESPDAAWQKACERYPLPKSALVVSSR